MCITNHRHLTSGPVLPQGPVGHAPAGPMTQSGGDGEEEEEEEEEETEEERKDKCKKDTTEGIPVEMEESTTALKVEPSKVEERLKEEVSHQV